MTKLTDTQLVILSAACQRPDRLVLPLPERLKGGAAQKVVGALLAKGFIAEVESGRDAPVWRQTDDGRGATLVANKPRTGPQASPQPRRRRAGPFRVPQRPRSRQRPAQRR